MTEGGDDVTHSHNHQPTRRRSLRRVAAASLIGLVAAPALQATASAAPRPTRRVDVPIDLCARPGTASLPTATATPATLTVWGYELGDCTTASSITKPGGPLLEVGQGDVVTVVLHNLLTESSALLFQGITIPTDQVGAAPSDGITPTTKSYTFTANAPGTHLYEAGLTPNAQHQVAMGLAGALVVRPATPNQVYAGASSAYDEEAVLVLGEIDPALNRAADKTTFDMRNFAAKYSTINGAVYPATAPIPSAPGHRVALRYVNAGMSYHSMSLLGTSQQIIGYDGQALTHPHRVTAETFGPGETVDAIVTVPASTRNGSRLVIHDGNLLLNNTNASGFGGMMTFIVAGTAAGPGDSVGPAVQSMSATPTPTNGGADVSVTANLSDVASGNSAVTAAEYFIDTKTANGSGTAMTSATFGAPTAAATATIIAANVAALPSGTHRIYVHAQDAAGNWGSFNLTTIVVDRLGPTISNAVVNPNPSTGTGMSVHATASDAATGGGTIVAAEYFVDPVGSPATGSGTAMTVNVSSSTASIDAALPTLTAGSHSVQVRAVDSRGNWGALASVAVTVVGPAGPTTSAVSASPAATNGTQGFSSSTNAVRVFATATSAVTNVNVAGAEGFISTLGVDGTGFAFVPSDGTWSSTTEAMFVNVPLTTVNALASGTYTIYVHSRDALGHWGAAATTTLIIDRTPPTVTGLSASPSPTNGATSATLAYTVNDAGGSGIAMIEWFVGADPGVGKGLQRTAAVGSSTAAIDTRLLAEGTNTITVRVKDGAGNIASATTTLVVTRPLRLSTVGNTNPPGVNGTADDADIYSWSGTAFSRTLDLSAAPYSVPLTANVDGYVNAPAVGTAFCVSFAADTLLPVQGTVRDGDVACWNGTRWTRFYQAPTTSTQAFGIDAFDIVGGTLYFSTDNTRVPGTTATTGDDADIYSWNGTAYTRVLDASTAPFNVPSSGRNNANIDGLSWIDATHVYVSFAGNTTIGGVTMADEDVAWFDGASWHVYFDGSAHGLTTANLSVDAFDVP